MLGFGVSYPPQTTHDERCKMGTTLLDKYDQLKAMMQELGSVAIAFSGGVDSTLLAKVAHDELGSRMVAVTARLRAVPQAEFQSATTWCAEQGIHHVVVPYDELTIPGYAQNPPNRCYICKRAVFGHILRVAQEQGIQHVVDGSNLDDDGDYRPGMRALAELDIQSPLKECGFTKADVRALSRELSLPTWNMPSAACLASRFAYGESITANKLLRVEQAEQYLRDLGFGQLRVRIHGEQGTLARIEVPQEDLAQLAVPGVRAQVTSRLRELGFTYVCLDLDGFRSGAMNETL